MPLLRRRTQREAIECLSIDQRGRTRYERARASLPREVGNMLSLGNTREGDNTLSTADEVDGAIHALVYVNKLLRDAGEKAAAAAGQTHARRMVLQSVGDGTTIADIARALGLQRQGVQRIADELVADGLGAYMNNPRHKKSKLFAVTPAGELTLAEVHEEHAAWLAELNEAAPEIDWASLHLTLARLTAALRANSHQPAQT